MMPEASSVYSSNACELFDPDWIADGFVLFSINVLSRRDKRGRPPGGAGTAHSKVRLTDFVLLRLDNIIHPAIFQIE